MLKRNLALLVLAAVLLGSGAYAWAQTSDTSPSAPSTTAPGAAPDRQAAVQQCLQQSGATDPKSATPDQRKAIRDCLKEKGVKRGRPGRAGPGKPGPGVLSRVVHGDLIVKGQDGKFENVIYDRGKQDSVKDNKLTITRPDDKKVTVTLTGDTKYKGVKDASELQDGRETLVVSKDGKALTVGQRGDKGGPQGQQPNGPKAEPTADEV
jgi:hypothetical protein